MNLAQRSVRSSAYNIGSSILQTVIAFIRSIILLRLLSPDVFGTYRFLGSFVFWTAALPMFGMGGALIHRAKESEGQTALQTHFTLTLIFNLLWGVGLGVMGYFFIKSSENYLAFLIILISQFFVNQTLTARSQLVRNVAFRRIAFLNLLSSILSALVVLFLAWRGFGLWSLVSTDLIQAGVMVLGLFIIRPVWRPSLGFARDSSKYFLNFGKRNFLNQPLLRTLDRVDDLWVGIFLGDEALGFYSRAYRLASYPGNLLASPLGSVATGTYAELKDSPKRLSQTFFRLNAFLIRASFLVGGLLTIIAPEFILIVAGEKWLPMVTTFRLMLIFTLLNPLILTISGLFIGVGKPEIVTNTRIFQLIVLVIGLIFFGANWGIEGTAISVDLMVITGIGIMIIKARKYAKFSILKLFFIPVLTFCISISCTYLLLDKFGPFPDEWISFWIKISAFLLIYLGLLFSLEYNELPQLIKILRKFRN